MCAITGHLVTFDPGDDTQMTYRPVQRLRKKVVDRRECATDSQPPFVCCYFDRKKRKYQGFSKILNYYAPVCMYVCKRVRARCVCVCVCYGGSTCQNKMFINVFQINILSSLLLSTDEKMFLNK